MAAIFPKMRQELSRIDTSIQPSTDPKFKPFKKPPKPTVLEEEVYVERMSRIIQRDFFPDLAKLNVQTQLLEAINHSDSNRATRLSFQLAQMTGKADSAAIGGEASWEMESIAQSISKEKEEELRLDEFHRKFTSEDNASFAEILEKNIAQQRAKYDYFFKGQGPKQVLSIEDQDRLTVEHISKPVITWNHEAKSALMYGPNSLPLCPADLPSTRAQAKELNPDATRFKIPETLDVKIRDSNISTKEAWRQMAKDTPGLFLPSGNTPTVNGYKFVPSTPTLEPDKDVNANEMITWGLIDSTPLLVDQGMGSSFSMAPTPHREVLATQLSNKASAALRRRQSGRSATPGKRGTASPAIALIQKSLRKGSGFDQALRSTYSTPKASTPSFTPLPSKIQTPKIGLNKTDKKQRGASITDNLLNF